MESLAPVLFVLFAILVVFLGVLGFLQARRRRQELNDWATANGWRFTPDSDYSMEDRHPGFSCLHEGSQRYAYNITQGPCHDRSLCAFDYHYETYSTDSKGRRQTHHHYFSAVVLETDLPLKPLFIRAEGFFDKITEFLGFDDIDFESSEFSKKFYVKSPDKKWAYDVLHQKTMEYLLEAPRYTLEFDGHCVIAYQSVTFSVQEFEAGMALIEGVLDRLPNYLIRELKGE